LTQGRSFSLVRLAITELPCLNRDAGVFSGNPPVPAPGKIRASRTSRKELVMRVWQIGVIGLAAALTVSVAGHSSQPPDVKEPATEPFAGKLILVTTSNNQNTLKNVQIRKLGDRSFVVGATVRDSTLTREDYPGRTMWLPVSEVLEIVEFDDLAQLRRLGNSRQETDRERR
jgi:hypothetical protein